MKVQIVRCVSVLLMGILFLVLGDSALSILIVAVGVLFMVPGLTSLFTYYHHRHERPMFPFAALGSFLLGFWLAVSPDFFVGIFMYVLGGVLIALGVYQFAFLAMSARELPAAWVLYLFPSLVLLLGVFVIFNPFAAAALPFILIGVGCIVSALNDLIAICRGHKCRRKQDGNVIENVTIIE